MNAILIHVSADEAEALTAAARVQGVPRKAFIRSAAVAAARLVDGRQGPVAALVAEIHAAICGKGLAGGVPGTASGELGAAVGALVNLGMPEQKARQRARAVFDAAPDADAAEIIRRACGGKD